MSNMLSDLVCGFTRSLPEGFEVSSNADSVVLQKKMMFLSIVNFLDKATHFSRFVRC
jgi:hypothetical protein